MKLTVKSLFVALLFLVGLSACEDFVVEDIEQEYIQLLAPADQLSTAQLTHTFWWDVLEGAEVYNMQLVEGSFINVVKLVLDTTIGKNKFTTSLSPGNFQWRVRGENNGGVTAYTTFSLVIDSSLNITNLQLVLTSPADNYITNNVTVAFTWNQLLNADDYLVEVHQNTWGGGAVFGPQIATLTSLTTTLPEGVLVWGVQARNSTSNSSTAFATRTITVDTTAPNAVILMLPADNATLNDVFNNYSWTQGSNTGTALSDDLYFYADAGATTLVKLITASGTTHQDSLGIGTYYWRVRSIDAATNIGAFSTLRKVTIQ